MNDAASYEALQTPALMAILTDPSRPPNAHLSGIDALAKRSESHRIPGFVSLFEKFEESPRGFSPDVMSRAVRVASEDDTVELTKAMLSLLPAVLRSVVVGPAYDQDFRSAFYNTVVNRQSNEDLDAWGQFIPLLDGRSIAGAIVDPVGQPLDALDPWELLERLEEPQRTAALMSVVEGVVNGMGTVEAVQKAVPMLRESSDDAELEQGLERLIGYWEQGVDAGRDKFVKNLESVLKALDRRPRTSMEKLTGKRPWAS